LWLVGAGFQPALHPQARISGLIGRLLHEGGFETRPYRIKIFAPLGLAHVSI
jgi:hypothetical protein